MGKSGEELVNAGIIRRNARRGGRSRTMRPELSTAYTRNVEDGFKKGFNVYTGQRGHRVLQAAVEQ